MELRIRQLTWKQVLIGITLPIFLFAPDNLYEVTSIYTSLTPADIDYKWLNYSFSVLFLIPVFWGLVFSLKQKNKILLFPLLLLLRSSCKNILGNENIITAGTYEIILTTIVGISLYVWVQYIIEKERIICWQQFFIYFIAIHVLSQLASFAFSLSGFSGRYNAINLDAECTGLLSGFALMYVFSSNHVKNKTILYVLFGIGTILSGARLPMILCIALILEYVVLSKKSSSLHIKLRSIVLFFLMISVAIFLLLFSPTLIDNLVQKGKLSSMSRIIDVFTGRDESSLGRLSSLFAGLKVLNKEPFGIDCGFIFLQRRMISYGYPTFPHSLLLTYYILFGPICLLIIIHNWRKEIGRSIRLLKRENKGVLSSIVLNEYLILFAIFTGGPIVNFKVIFIYLLLIKMASGNIEDRNKYFGII